MRTPLANAKLMRKWGKSKSVMNFIYNKTGSPTGRIPPKREILRHGESPFYVIRYYRLHTGWTMLQNTYFAENDQAGISHHQTDDANSEAGLHHIVLFDESRGIGYGIRRCGDGQRHGA